MNAVSPGITETALIGNYTEEQRTNMTQRFPLGRFVQPAEIAEAGLYLISDKASFMTGEIMRTNGGSSVKKTLEYDPLGSLNTIQRFLPGSQTRRHRMFLHNG